MKLQNLCRSFTESGFSILDIDKPTPIYNNNNTCVQWSHNMTLKAGLYIEFRKYLVHEWVQDKTVSVENIAGKLNPANIFTKEMLDGTHFCCLRNSLMSWLLDFFHTTLLETHHAHQWSQHSVAPSAAWVGLALGVPSYFSALAANSSCRAVTAMSHLSCTGQQYLIVFWGFIPLDLT